MSHSGKLWARALKDAEEQGAVTRALNAHAVELDGGEFRFFVPGVAAPKGSGKAVMSHATGRALVLHDNKRTKPWQASVAAHARQAGLVPANDVAVSLAFFRSRPAGHFKADGSLKPAAPRAPATKPDIDKLIRTVLDALKGLAYPDDARVTEIRARKAWACSEGGNVVLDYEARSNPPGVVVVVEPRGGP